MSNANIDLQQQFERRIAAYQKIAKRFVICADRLLKARDRLWISTEASIQKLKLADRQATVAYEKAKSDLLNACGE